MVLAGDYCGSNASNDYGALRLSRPSTVNQSGCVSNTPFSCLFFSGSKFVSKIIDTEYDRAKIPLHNGSDPTSPLEV